MVSDSSASVVLESRVAESGAEPHDAILAGAAASAAPTAAGALARPPAATQHEPPPALYRDPPPYESYSLLTPQDPFAVRPLDDVAPATPTADRPRVDLDAILGGDHHLAATAPATRATRRLLPRVTPTRVALLAAAALALGIGGAAWEHQLTRAAARPGDSAAGEADPRPAAGPAATATAPGPARAAALEATARRPAPDPRAGVAGAGARSPGGKLVRPTPPRTATRAAAARLTPATTAPRAVAAAALAAPEAAPAAPTAPTAPPVTPAPPAPVADEAIKTPAWARDVEPAR